jgi:branched-chain amino acid transport system permease protein
VIMSYLVSLLTLISIYTVITASMDLILGYTGMYSFAQAALFGVAAYTAALVAMTFGQGFVVSLLAATVVTTAVAFAIVFITSKLDGDYFVLGTFCAASVISSVLDNWIDVTNGANGLYNIPVATLAGFAFPPGAKYLALSLVTAAIVLLLKARLVSAPFGLTLQAIRDDEVGASVLGYDVRHTRIASFAIGGIGSAIAGTLLAFYLRFLDPTSFTFGFTMFVWAALFVGGAVSNLGSILGPAILVLFPEALRFAGLDGTYVAAFQQAMYGLLLVLLIVFRPQGMAGGYTPR